MCRAETSCRVQVEVCGVMRWQCDGGGIISVQRGLPVTSLSGRNGQASSWSTVCWPASCSIAFYLILVLVLAWRVVRI